MSTTDNTSAHDADERKVAHELANLVDGSLRNLGLALSDLRDIDADSTLDDATMQRILTARAGMEKMAGLLKHWMVAARSPAGHLDEHLTMAVAMERAVHLIEPAAMQLDIELVIDHTPIADAISAGPVFTVMVNGLRNAIDAIAGAEGPRPRDGWRVEIACRSVDSNFELTIRDNGPGIDPAMLDDRGEIVAGRTTRTQGQGVGLALAAEVADALCGSIALRDIQPRGVELKLSCPMDRFNIKEGFHGG